MGITCWWEKVLLCLSFSVSGCVAEEENQRGLQFKMEFSNKSNGKNLVAAASSDVLDM